MEVAQRTKDQIWFRGYGSDQYVYYAREGPKQFLGASFQVESYQDLEKSVYPYALIGVITETHSELLNFQPPGKYKR